MIGVGELVVADGDRIVCVIDGGNHEGEDRGAVTASHGDVMVIEQVVGIRHIVHHKPISFVMAFIGTDGVHKLNVTIFLRVEFQLQGGVTAPVLTGCRYNVRFGVVLEQKGDVVVVALLPYNNAVGNRPADILQSGEGVKGVGEHLADAGIGFAFDVRDVFRVRRDKQGEIDYAVAGTRRGGDDERVFDDAGLCRADEESVFGIDIVFTDGVEDVAMVVSHFQLQNVGTVAVLVLQRHDPCVGEMTCLIWHDFKTMFSVQSALANRVVIGGGETVDNVDSGVEVGAEDALPVRDEECCRDGIGAAGFVGMGGGKVVDNVCRIAEVPQNAVTGIVDLNAEINGLVGTIELIGRDIGAQHVVHIELFSQRYGLGTGGITIGFVIAESVNVGNESLLTE